MVKRVYGKLTDRAIWLYVLTIMAVLDAKQVMAQGVGDLGSNITSNVPGVAKAIQVIAFLAGLTFVVMGLMEFYNNGKKPDATIGGGVKKCGLGVVLLALGAIITAFSSTIFGSDESGSGLGDLGL